MGMEAKPPQRARRTMVSGRRTTVRPRALTKVEQKEQLRDLEKMRVAAIGEQMKKMSMKGGFDLASLVMKANFSIEAVAIKLQRIYRGKIAQRKFQLQKQEAFDRFVCHHCHQFNTAGAFCMHCGKTRHSDTLATMIRTFEVPTSARKEKEVARTKPNKHPLRGLPKSQRKNRGRLASNLPNGADLGTPPQSARAKAAALRGVTQRDKVDEPSGPTPTRPTMCRTNMAYKDVLDTLLLDEPPPTAWLTDQVSPTGKSVAQEMDDAFVLADLDPASRGRRGIGSRRKSKHRKSSVASDDTSNFMSLF
jgi:hypothetical protein